MNEWISVEDRLPEIGEPCLLTDGDKMATSQRIALDGVSNWAAWGSYGFCGYEWEWEIGTPTYWMPLPEPPNPETGGGRMKKNDGGPSYPESCNGQIVPGMTIRQYYKAAALSGIDLASLGENVSDKLIAQWCGRMADAMLAEDQEER